MTLFMVFIYVVVFLVSAIYFLFKIKFQYWTKRGVPCLEPVIPFGNLGTLKTRYHPKDVFDKVYKEFKGKASFAGMIFFIRPTALALDLDLVQHILIKDFNKLHDRGGYFNERDDPLSAHLVTLHGPKWRTLRSKLTPTFTSGKMKFMFPTIVKVANEFEETLREQLKMQSELEIKELLARFTTDVIGTCAFGIECNSLKDTDTEFRKMGRLSFENPRHKGWIRALIMQFPQIALKLRVKNIRDDVSEFFINVVRETVDFREKNNVRRNDFMDLLIQLKNGKDLDSDKGGIDKLSMEEIAAQAFIFFLAGFETSSTNMGYSLYELALNPDIQNRARKEINDVLERHNGNFTYEAMMEMTYMDWLIHESLRKYPPVIAVPRLTDCDYQVPNSGKIIEKGIRVLVPIYSIHHDPEIYHNPDVFDPERFSPDEIKKRHPMSFLGFGDGPRNCIGARFGLMQSRIGLITLLKNFQFSPCNKTPDKLQFKNTMPILTPEGGLWLNVETLK